MLDYKSIIVKRYALHLSGREIAKQIGASKSGVNEFLKMFEECESISYPLPAGITNYGIGELVYGNPPGNNGRNANIVYPDYEEVHKQLSGRKNMTLVFLWNRYKKRCEESDARYYQYRQFCEHYAQWCEENAETLHFNAVIAEKMEVDFAGKTFEITDPLTGEIYIVVVFVAILPYSQYIYAEGMLSTKEPEWIDVNNHALDYFEGVPTIVVCDNWAGALLYETVDVVDDHICTGKGHDRSGRDHHLIESLYTVMYPGITLPSPYIIRKSCSGHAVSDDDEQYTHRQPYKGSYEKDDLFIKCKVRVKISFKSHNVLPDARFSHYTTKLRTQSSKCWHMLAAAWLADRIVIIISAMIIISAISLYISIAGWYLNCDSKPGVKTGRIHNRTLKALNI